MKLFMIDIESTGVDQDNDDIIEIGIVQMMKGQDGFYFPERERHPPQTREYHKFHDFDFHTFVHTGKEPQSKFAKEHMVDVYKKANATPAESTESIHGRVKEWLLSKGSEGAKNTYFCGWNASTFDLSFMVKKGYLQPSGYDKDDNLIGDFHYRPYEISGAIELACDVLGYSREVVLGMAKETKKKPEIELPEGKDHDALYDCYTQIDMLNGLIAITRK